MKYMLLTRPPDLLVWPINTERMIKTAAAMVATIGVKIQANLPALPMFAGCVYYTVEKKGRKERIKGNKKMRG